MNDTTPDPSGLRTAVTAVWLLDVDGVINASRPGWGGAPARAQILAAGDWWKIRWAPEVVDLIRDVHASGAAEIRWATTWMPWIQELERLWSLPELPRAFPASTADMNAAKLEAALAVVRDERRPLIWTDDEQIPTAGPDLAALSATGQGALLIAPSSTRGLRREHVDQIRCFLGL